MAAYAIYYVFMSMLVGVSVHAIAVPLAGSKNRQRKRAGAICGQTPAIPARIRDFRRPVPSGCRSHGAATPDHQWCPGRLLPV